MAETKTPKKKVANSKPKTKPKKKEAPEPQEQKEAVQVIERVVEKEAPEVTKLDELQLDRSKIELLKRTIAKGATDDELLMFVNVCKGLGLSPFLRHVHLVKRWDSKLGQEVAAVQVGIDGFRSIAESTNAYAGNDDPVFDKEEEKTAKIKRGNSTTEETYMAPNTAKVVVRKIVSGQPFEFSATARWDEFYPGDRQGFMWRTKPHVMLGKCAEAQALRKAFPKVLGGVYVPEELEQAGTLKAPEQQRDEKFSKAKDMIAKTTNTDGLFSFLEKLEQSETYTKDQKKELVKITEARIKELDAQEEVTEESYDTA